VWFVVNLYKGNFALVFLGSFLDVSRSRMSVPSSSITNSRPNDFAPIARDFAISNHARFTRSGVQSYDDLELQLFSTSKDFTSFSTRGGKILLNLSRFSAVLGSSFGAALGFAFLGILISVLILV